MAKRYVYKCTSITISKSQIMANGKNAGNLALHGLIQVKTKINGEEKTVSKVFSAFDSGKITAASRIQKLVEAGHSELYLKCEFIDGPLIDKNDPSKGKWQNLKVLFVETPEERAAFLESLREKNSSEKAEEATAETETAFS